MVWALNVRPPLHTPAPFVLTLALATACKRSDCESMTELDRQDWCFHGRATSATEKGDLDAAILAIGEIDSPMVRALATEQLISAAPTGLDVQKAEQLCNALQEPHRSSCVKSWTRPHLWSK